ncbi:hypothetical protein [Reinekea sp. G2M2-21]|uniref:hypothetical protein n=1 Tax=Reinekea sp. G2M2-21 TaxID=2788942 RepID=UPI0018A9A7C4|nr:hypothetical protein [Reinekea sp. G2M2-21]
MSVMSFPDRGPWGNSRYRGNCSGYFYQQLFTQLNAKSFCDPMIGSGTSIEVAKEMGLESVHGLDLHSGFNAIRDSILSAIGGLPVDLCFSHPPYHTVLPYSGPGGMWGTDQAPHIDDLSACPNVDDFYDKMVLVLVNQREATKAGGHYGTLIADQRKNGQYHSFQAELIARMPRDELKAVLIKLQHNTMSGLKTYSRMKYPCIEHEYAILWQKPERGIYLLPVMAKQAYDRVKSAWKVIVRSALMMLGGKASLKEIYAYVSNSHPDRVDANPNYEAKIRQVLQLTEWFDSSERGVWQLAA